MFIVRADGNSKIGMGHIMRCMSIACNLKEQGQKVAFLTACEESKKTIEENGFAVRLLPTDYQEMETELPYIKPLMEELRAELGEPKPPEINIEALKESKKRQRKKREMTELEKEMRPSLISAKKPDVILLDSYEITTAYVMKLREIAMLAYLEDLGLSMPVDLLINYNIYGMRFYYKTLPNVSLKVLLGPEFMPLRKEFSDYNDYEIRDKVENVMITTGGSDPLFATKNLLNELLRAVDFQEAGIKFHVVSGPYNTYAEQLVRIYGKNSNVVIHKNVTSMKELMRACDVVISATGSTIYEVCALGVPLISFHFAENQRLIDEMLPLITSVESIGDYSSSPVHISRKIVPALRSYVNDLALRKKLYAEERKLVDGQGARRVAEAMIALSHEFWEKQEKEKKK